MLSLNLDRSKRIFRLKEIKSVGNLILSNKKKLIKLKERQSKNFIEALTKLNDSLKKSESLTNVPNTIKKNNSVMNIFKLKEMYLKKRREKYEQLPNINQNKLNLNEENNKIITPNKLLILNKSSSFNTKNIYPISTKNSEESKIPFYFKALNFPKKPKPASQIIKTSKIAINSGTPFKKYCFNLEENVGDYVENKDIFSGYDRFNDVLKQYIKNEMTGLTMPGNIINRDVIGYKKTVHPKNVKVQIKRNIPVPNKTLVPIPRELAEQGISCSHINLKDVYNEKNKLL